MVSKNNYSQEYVKVLEEKRSLEKHLGNLSEENARLNVMLQKRLDKKEMQLRSMELDRFRADKFSRENEQLAKEVRLKKVFSRIKCKQYFAQDERGNREI